MQSATWGAFPRLMIGSHLACYDLAKADHDLGLQSWPNLGLDHARLHRRADVDVIVRRRDMQTNMACWLWCAGQLSQSHANVSLNHLVA